MRVLSGLLFAPRGGSAQVARSIANQLPACGWDVRVVSGSSSQIGDARTFYGGLDVEAVDFDAGDAPMHPSYEDRPGAPDRCFALVDDAEYKAHVEAWGSALDSAGAAESDLLHLHHLTPLNEAAANVAPDVPIVAHLHGTEMLMLEEIEDGAPDHWRYAAAWRERMCRWATQADRLIVLTPGHAERAALLLGVPAEKCVVVPNGFDPALFKPALVDRAAFWQEHLVREPRGWSPGGLPGSISYSRAEVAGFADSVVLLAVGRYTAVKRLGVMVAAFEKARGKMRRKTALVIVGGHPGEYEGRHPAELIASSGARDVFLAGWHEHAALPPFFNAADVQVLASVKEQFGLVLAEGMACALPAIAVARHGPAEIVRDGETGWLVEPDDEDALAAAMVDAVDDPDERARRGLAARKDARAQWSWPALARRLATVFEDAAGVARSDRASL